MTTATLNKPLGLRYAVASGKGGVGKTSVTLSLATVLAKQGRRVLVLDADTGLANADLQLNLQPQHDLAHVLSGSHTLADIQLTAPQGFTLLPGRAGHQGLINLSQPAVTALIGQLQSLADAFDITLIDVAAGLQSPVLHLCAAAQHTLLLTTPDPAAFMDAYALIKVLWQQQGVANAQLVVNQATVREAEAVHTRLNTATQHFLQLPPLPLLGSIPTCKAFAAAVRGHQLPAVAAPHSPAMAAIEQLAGRLATRLVGR